MAVRKLAIRRGARIVGRSNHNGPWRLRQGGRCHSGGVGACRPRRPERRQRPARRQRLGRRQRQIMRLFGHGENSPWEGAGPPSASAAIQTGQSRCRAAYAALVWHALRLRASQGTPAAGLANAPTAQDRSSPPLRPAFLYEQAPGPRQRLCAPHQPRQYWHLPP